MEQRAHQGGHLLHRAKETDDAALQVVRSVSDEEAKTKFPGGWKAPKPYIRIVSQPKQGRGSYSVRGA